MCASSSLLEEELPLTRCVVASYELRPLCYTPNYTVCSCLIVPTLPVFYSVCVIVMRSVLEPPNLER